MTVSQASWVGTPHIRGYSEPMRMFLLTASIIGLQFAWGTEVSIIPKAAPIACDFYSRPPALELAMLELTVDNWCR